MYFLIRPLLEARAEMQKYFHFFCQNENLNICFRDLLTFIIHWHNFNPIAFTFSENSTYCQKSLLEGKTLLDDVNKLFVFKSLVTMPSNVLPLHLKQTFPPIIWIFNADEDDGIESRLPFKIFSTLHKYHDKYVLHM